MKNEKEWKKLNRASACTSPPWAPYIEPHRRAEVLRLIRQDCIDELGYSIDECPKRKVCMKKTCMGRPLPWFSEHAKPYLEKMSEEMGLKEGEEYEVKTDCSTCPFFDKCKSPCNQVLDYLERDRVLEPQITYQDYLEKIKIEEPELEPVQLNVSPDEIPWDTLTERKQIVVRKYLYEQRDFRSVAAATGMYNQAAAKYEFYSALNRLAEYAIMRKFIKENAHRLTPRQYEILSLVYFENKKIVEVAEELNISKQSTQQTVARVKKKFNIKIHKFVNKRQGKTKYFTLNVLKD
jgi:DNA-binding CsgD family transcriptional regulator